MVVFKPVPATLKEMRWLKRKLLALFGLDFAGAPLLDHVFGEVHAPEVLVVGELKAYLDHAGVIAPAMHDHASVGAALPLRPPEIEALTHAEGAAADHQSAPAADQHGFRQLVDLALGITRERHAEALRHARAAAGMRAQLLQEAPQFRAHRGLHLDEFEAELRVLLLVDEFAVGRYRDAGRQVEAEAAVLMGLEGATAKHERASKADVLGLSKTRRRTRRDDHRRVHVDARIFALRRERRLACYGALAHANLPYDQNVLIVITSTYDGTAPWFNRCDKHLVGHVTFVLALGRGGVVTSVRG